MGHRQTLVGSPWLDNPKYSKYVHFSIYLIEKRKTFPTPINKSNSKRIRGVFIIITDGKNHFIPQKIVEKQNRK
jgi:hypothetical protein